MKNSEIGLLFTGEERNVNLAISHLRIHDGLYWSIPSNIMTKKYNPPINSYVCVKGKKIAYKCRIKKILPFHLSHFDSKCKKPLLWISERKSGQNKRNYRYSFLITKIYRNTAFITDLVKVAGGNVRNPPQGIVNIKIK